jgi:hypothetical protein
MVASAAIVGGAQTLRFMQKRKIMLDHFDGGVSRDQTCKWGIEWYLCAPINHAANFPYLSDAYLISKINWGIDRGSVSLAQS